MPYPQLDSSAPAPNRRAIRIATIISISCLSSLSADTVRWARNRRLVGDANKWTLWQESVLSLPFVFVERRAFRELRKWSLNQLASAAYRDLAVLVTAVHVLVLRFDRFDGQPRWVLLAARPQDVRLQAFGTVVGVHTTIVVSRGNQRFAIKGTARIAQAEPVLAAWRLAVSGTARTA